MLKLPTSLRLLISVVVLGGAVAPAFGQPTTPVSRDDVDKRLSRQVFEAVKTGVDLYNGGKKEACLGLYQGALTVAVEFLDHRPKLKSTVTDGMSKAKLQTTEEAAFTLRGLLDQIQSEVSATAAAMPDKKPLWTRLGGEPAVKAVVKDFVIAAAKDPKVNFFRDGKYKLDAAGVEKLQKLLVEMISSATGGPLKYTGRNMKESHAGMKITDAEFGALAGHLIDTLKKFNVPQTEIDELVAIVASTKGDIVEVK